MVLSHSLAVSMRLRFCFAKVKMELALKSVFVEDKEVMPRTVRVQTGRCPVAKVIDSAASREHARRASDTEVSDSARACLRRDDFRQDVFQTEALKSSHTLLHTLEHASSMFPLWHGYPATCLLCYSPDVFHTLVRWGAGGGIHG